MVFVATEFDAATQKATGRRNYCSASNLERAVAVVLYSRIVAAGHAGVDYTGRVVLSGKYNYKVTSASSHEE